MLYHYWSFERRRFLRAFLTVGAVAFGLRFIWGNLPLQPIPSEPRAPIPNSFDTYFRAGRMIESDHYVIDTAFSKLREKDRPAAAQDWKEAERLVKAHADALAILRSGFSGECRLPPQNPYASESYLTQFHTLGYLLVLEGKLKARAGDPRGSVDSFLDAVRLGEDVSHGAAVIGYMGARSAEYIGLRPLGDSTFTFSADNSLYAARRLAETRNRHASVAEALAEEKLYCERTMSGLLQSPVGWALGVIWPRRQIMQNLCDGMDAAIARTHEPFNAHAAPLPQPSDPLNKIVLPVFTHLDFREDSSSTYRILVTTALALHAYEMEHNGAPPDTLSALAPHYLPFIPQDPFQPGHAICYIRKLGRDVLYSVGPDSIDDGGRPIENPKPADQPNWNEMQRRRAEKDSVGDIVFGVNY